MIGVHVKDITRDPNHKGSLFFFEFGDSSIHTENSIFEFISVSLIKSSKSKVDLINSTFHDFKSVSAGLHWTIEFYESTINIEHSKFTKITTMHGSVIFVIASNFTFIDTNFHDNEAQSIMIKQSKGIITNSTFYDNVDNRALFIEDCVITIDSTNFKHLGGLKFHDQGGGGALYIHNSDSIIKNTLF